MYVQSAFVPWPVKVEGPVSCGKRTVQEFSILDDLFAITGYSSLRRNSIMISELPASFKNERLPNLTW